MGWYASSVAELQSVIGAGTVASALANYDTLRDGDRPALIASPAFDNSLEAIAGSITIEPTTGWEFVLWDSQKLVRDPGNINWDFSDVQPLLDRFTHYQSTIHHLLDELEADLKNFLEDNNLPFVLVISMSRYGYYMPLSGGSVAVDPASAEVLVDVEWNGGVNSRTDMKLYSVIGDVLSVKWGSGDALPAATTAVTLDGLAGVLTTRSGDNNGVVTLNASGHGITTNVWNKIPRRRFSWVWSAIVTDIFNGDAAVIGAKGVGEDLAKYLANHNRLTRVVLDSERMNAIQENDLSNLAATNAGHSGFQTWVNPPGGGAYTNIIANDDAELARLRFHEDRRHWDVWHSTIIGIAQGLWPGLEFTTDNQYYRHQYDSMDAVQEWLGSGAWPPSGSNRCGFMASLAQCRNRVDGTNKKIIIGPHLGWPIDGTERPTPPDVFSINMWLALAYGASGTVHWGLDQLFDNTATFRNATCEQTWDALKDFRDNVIDAITDSMSATFLTSWKPSVDRRIAFWDCEVNRFYNSGRDSDACARPTVAGGVDVSQNRDWLDWQSWRNMWQAAQYLGEPMDIIWDEDILNGELSEYEVLLVPAAYVVTEELYNAVVSFVSAGGYVIIHKGSIFETEGEIGFSILDGTYCSVGAGNPVVVDRGSLAPGWRLKEGLSITEYETFIAALRADIRSKLPFTPCWDMGVKDIILNRMTYRSREYYIIVNDERTGGGTEDTWFFDTYGLRKIHDVGVAATIDNETNQRLQDIISGEVFDPGDEISLPAAGGRVLVGYEATGKELTANENRMHFTAKENKPQYTVKGKARWGN